MFVCTRDVEKCSQSPYGIKLQRVLLLVLLLDRVSLDLGGAGQLEWLHQLVQLLQHSPKAQLAYSKAILVSKIAATKRKPK